MRTPIAVVVLGLAVVVGWEAFDTDYVTVVAEPETSWEEATELFQNAVGPEYTVRASPPVPCDSPDPNKICYTDFYSVSVSIGVPWDDTDGGWERSTDAFGEYGYRVECHVEWEDVYSLESDNGFFGTLVSDHNAPIRVTGISPMPMGETIGTIVFDYSVAADGTPGLHTLRPCAVPSGKVGTVR